RRPSGHRRKNPAGNRRTGVSGIAGFQHGRGKFLIEPVWDILLSESSCVGGCTLRYTLTFCGAPSISRERIIFRNRVFTLNAFKIMAIGTPVAFGYGGSKHQKRISREKIEKEVYERVFIACDRYHLSGH